MLFENVVGKAGKVLLHLNQLRRKPTRIFESKQTLGKGQIEQGFKLNKRPGRKETGSYFFDEEEIDDEPPPCPPFKFVPTREQCMKMILSAAYHWL